MTWLPGRSLWYPADFCQHAHSAEYTFKLPHALSFVGQIDQVLACMQACRRMRVVWRGYAPALVRGGWLCVCVAGRVCLCGLPNI